GAGLESRIATGGAGGANPVLPVGWQRPPVADALGHEPPRQAIHLPGPVLGDVRRGRRPKRDPLDGGRRNGPRLSQADLASLACNIPSILAACSPALPARSRKRRALIRSPRFSALVASRAASDACSSSALTPAQREASRLEACDSSRVSSESA